MPQEFDAYETFDFDDQVDGEFIKVSTITTSNHEPDPGGQEAPSQSGTKKHLDPGSRVHL